MLIVPAVIAAISSSIPIGMLFLISKCADDEDIANVCHLIIKFLFYLFMIMSYVLAAIIVFISD